MTSIVSIDLETLSLAPDAAILSLGIYGEYIKYEFFFDVDEQIKAGASVEWATVKWWLTQSEEARLAQVNANRSTLLESAFRTIKAKLESAYRDDFIVISNPASFDLAILRWHWMRLGLDAPWSHHAERCYRTYRAQIDPKRLKDYEAAAVVVHPGPKHSALVDAQRQYHVLKMALHDGLDIA